MSYQHDIRRAERKRRAVKAALLIMGLLLAMTLGAIVALYMP